MRAPLRSLLLTCSVCCVDALFPASYKARQPLRTTTNLVTRSSSSLPSIQPAPISSISVSIQKSRTVLPSKTRQPLQTSLEYVNGYPTPTTAPIDYDNILQFVAPGLQRLDNALKAQDDFNMKTVLDDLNFAMQFVVKNAGLYQNFVSPNKAHKLEMLTQDALRTFAVYTKVADDIQNSTAFVYPRYYNGTATLHAHMTSYISLIGHTALAQYRPDFTAMNIRLEIIKSEQNASQDAALLHAQPRNAFAFPRFTANSVDAKSQHNGSQVVMNARTKLDLDFENSSPGAAIVFHIVDGRLMDDANNYFYVKQGLGGEIFHGSALPDDGDAKAGYWSVGQQGQLLYTFNDSIGLFYLSIQREGRSLWAEISNPGYGFSYAFGLYAYKI